MKAQQRPIKTSSVLSEKPAIANTVPGSERRPPADPLNPDPIPLEVSGRGILAKDQKLVVRTT